MGIDTNDVLEAAGTKWNFLQYKPGLVGGHCIGVDPYYLAHKATQLGYHPEVILSGRKVNDNMGIFVANKVVRLMINNGIQVKGSRALLLGITFKENCPDIRNTKVIDIYKELISFGLIVDIYDPNANKYDVKKELGISLIDTTTKYDVIILAVAHKQFNEIDFESLKLSSNSITFDIKGTLPRSTVNQRL
jgi:UDP-N-acetyl-D-galactosamine dehydrogenase